MFSKVEEQEQPAEILQQNILPLNTAKYGLKTVGDETSYYQNIPMHGSFPLPTSELKILLGR